MLVVYDSETLKYQDSGIANVSALALDDGAQRLYVSSTLATAITTTENALHVLDESTLNPIAQQSLPARVTAMALNEKTQHLFLAYHGDAVHPTAADDVVEIRDMRTFAQVGTFRVAGEPSAMAFLGDNLYVASSTATDLTVVRDCPEAAPPPPTRTPLPAPSLAPTTTPFPTLTAAPPTPVKPITSWRTYANAMMGYRISYPSTWYLSADNPPNTVFVTSFRMQSSGHGGLPPGSVKIDIGVSPQAEPTVPPPNSQPKRFCVDSRCGTRIELRGSFTDPSAQGLNRLLYIQIPVGKSRYDINAMMADPPADANRNAAIVEQIIASFHFTRP